MEVHPSLEIQKKQLVHSCFLSEKHVKKQSLYFSIQLIKFYIFLKIFAIVIVNFIYAKCCYCIIHYNIVNDK